MLFIIVCQQEDSHILAVRIISCFLRGIAAGLLVRFFFKNKLFFRFYGFSGPHNHGTGLNLLMRFLKNLSRNIKATGLYFLIGIVRSAVFQRYVPSEAIQIRIAEIDAEFKTMLQAIATDSVEDFR